VRDRLDEFDGAEVVVVTFTRPRNLAGYRRRFAEPLRVVADPDRVLYRALGLGRGGWWQIWGPATMWRYATLVARGRRPEPSREDTRQLGGDAVIDAEGRVQWRYQGSGPDDRPSVDELLDALRGLTEQS
jgi:hypothetical protein